MGIEEGSGSINQVFNKAIKPEVAKNATEELIFEVIKSQNQEDVEEKEKEESQEQKLNLGETSEDSIELVENTIDYIAAMENTIDYIATMKHISLLILKNKSFSAERKKTLLHTINEKHDMAIGSIELICADADLEKTRNDFRDFLEELLGERLN